MGGINDVTKEFRSRAAPGTVLKAVRMYYDNDAGEQVFEFDVVTAEGPRTVSHRALPDDKIDGIASAAVDKAQAPVDAPLGLMSMPDLGPRQIDLEEAIASTVEHKGETYELAHDGAPKALFF